MLMKILWDFCRFFFLHCHFFRCLAEEIESISVVGRKDNLRRNLRYLGVLSGCKNKDVNAKRSKCSNNERKWIIEENNVRVSDLYRLNMRKKKKRNKMQWMAWKKKPSEIPFRVYNRKFIGFLRLIIFINEITMCSVQSQSSFTLFAHKCGGYEKKARQQQWKLVV